MAVWIFSPGLSQETFLAPSLIWPGHSGLGVCHCVSPPSTVTEGWGPPLVTWDSGAAEAWAGLKVEGGGLLGVKQVGRISIGIRG